MTQMQKEIMWYLINGKTRRRAKREGSYIILQLTEEDTSGETLTVEPIKCDGKRK
jgi:hypothetical protein